MRQLREQEALAELQRIEERLFELDKRFTGNEIWETEERRLFVQSLARTYDRVIW